MPIELTSEQSAALNQSDEAPIRIVDPRTQIEYLLVPNDGGLMLEIAREQHIHRAFAERSRRNMIKRLQADQ